jgi:hypothetical protein
MFVNQGAIPERGRRQRHPTEALSACEEAPDRKDSGAMSTLTAVQFERARRALGTTQSGLGAMLGVSRRTAQRWASHGATLVPARLASLVEYIHPHEPALARELAATLGQTLEDLGIVPPPPPPPPQRPPPPPPAPPPPPSAAIVDAVVCAAAEAMELTPREVRAGLHAAFARARELGLSVEGVVDALKASLPRPARVGAAP